MQSSFKASAISVQIECNLVQLLHIFSATCTQFEFKSNAISMQVEYNSDAILMKSQCSLYACNCHWNKMQFQYEMNAT